MASEEILLQKPSRPVTGVEDWETHGQPLRRSYTSPSVLSSHLMRFKAFQCTQTLSQGHNIYLLVICTFAYIRIVQIVGTET
jgi:hypothetical protein